MNIHSFGYVKRESALRAVGSLSLMEELVHYEQEGWTKGNLAVPEDESAAEWARGIESLRQLKTEYGLEEETFGSDFAVSLLASLLQEENRGLILGEVLRCMRKERGMSVEELADGICDVAHLRKLELGRMQPHMDTYTMLMERLGKEGCRYYPIIQTEDYRMYECRQKVAQYLGGYEYEKAEYELRKLENGLDLRESTNRRLILELRAAFDSMRKRITSAEKLELLYKALGEKAADRENLSKRSLLREEVLIWNNIAITLEELGRREEGIAIYQDILASYESSALGIESNKKEYLLILRNLVGFLGRDGDHEEAIKISELGIRLSLECKIGNYLVVFLHIKAWNFERMLEKEEKGKENIKEACLSLYRQAFHVAFMIKHRYYKQRIQEHCVKYYGINIRKIKEYR